MLYHAKSLVFLLPICWIAMQFVAKPFVVIYFTEDEFKRYRNVLLSVIVAYFIAPNTISYFFIICILVWRFRPKSPIERIYLYVFLSISIPVGANYKVSAGPIETVLIINGYLLLAVLLLPSLVKNTIKEKGLLHGSADFYVLGYYGLVCILNFRGSSVTEGVREALQLVVTMYLPYMAISRTISNRSDVEKILVVMLLALLPVAMIGLFEALRGWQIISDRSAFFSGNYYRKEYRAGLLRARSVYFSPITLGTAMMLLIGIYMYFSSEIKGRLTRYGIFFLSLGGSLASFSRMPWLATFLVFIFQNVFNKGVFRLFASTFVVLMVGLVFIKYTEIGERVGGLIPFIGGEAERQDSVDYRSRLIEVGLDVARENIAFGTPYFLENPKMEVMRQGQGIIDMVNTHLTVLLAYGGVTLAFFWLMFLVPVARTGFGLILNRSQDQKTRRLGILLCGLTLGQLANLISMSNIDAIPIFYTITLALLVALLSNVNGMKSTNHREIVYQ